MDLSNVTSVDSFYILHLLFVAICKVLTLIQSAHPHKPAGPVTFFQSPSLRLCHVLGVTMLVAYRYQQVASVTWTMKKV